MYPYSLALAAQEIARKHLDDTEWEQICRKYGYINLTADEWMELTHLVDEFWR